MVEHLSSVHKLFLGSGGGDRNLTPFTKQTRVSTLPRMQRQEENTNTPMKFYDWHSLKVEKLNHCYMFVTKRTNSKSII